MAYTSNTVAGLDVNTPDGATERVNILDAAIREVKRAVKNDLDPKVTQLQTDLDAAEADLAAIQVSVQSATLTNEQTLTNAGTWYDVLSLSLPAGTWVIEAQGTIRLAAGTVEGLFRITDHSTVFSSTGVVAVSSTYRGSCCMVAVVTLAVTTTIYLQANGSYANTIVCDQISAGDSGDTATKLVAIKTD